MARPISYSSARLFEQCPARWKAEKIDRIKGERVEHLETGTFLHEVTEQYLKHLQRGGMSHDYEYADRLFQQMWAARAQAIPEALHEELSEVWTQIREHLVMRNIGQMVEAELKLAVDESWCRVDWDSPSAWLRLKIDRLDVDGDWRATVWDLKTGRKIESAEESQQGKVYAAAVVEAFPKVREVVFELYYPRFDVTKSYRMSAADVAEGRRWITGLSKRIQEAGARNGWRPTPGPACMDCPVFYNCEARATKLSAAPPRDLRQAEAQLERLLLLDRERGDLQEALKTWLDAYGPIEVNGMVAGYTLINRFEFPTDKLLPILEANGVSIIKVLKADTKKLERYASKNDRLRGELKAICVNKSSTGFKIVRAGNAPAEAA